MLLSLSTHQLWCTPRQLISQSNWNTASFPLQISSQGYYNNNQACGSSLALNSTITENVIIFFLLLLKANKDHAQVQPTNKKLAKSLTHSRLTIITLGEHSSWGHMGNSLSISLIY
jgi:hypothetical protein